MSQQDIKLKLEQFIEDNKQVPEESDENTKQ